MMISVVGAREASAEALNDAEAVGRAIALHGAVLVCGGLGGVMEAACRGARAEGGHTIGLLPGDDPAAANAYVEFPIATGLGVARNAVVARAADAMIAIGGAYGTLSEIAFALQFGTPVIGLGTWPLQDLDGAQPILPAEGPRDAVALALRLAAASE